MGRWVPLAGREGGTVPAIAFSPSFPLDQQAFAATYTGVFRSRDAGRSWEICGGRLGSLVVQAIAFSPSFQADRTIFAGATDGGVYRSSDAGDNWTCIATLGGGQAVAALAAAPGTGGGLTVMAGTLDAGVFASTDGGREWKACNSGLPDLSVIAVMLSPAFKDDRTAFAATAKGLHISTDGGSSWRQVWTGREDGVQYLAISPDFSTDRTVFAGTENQGVLRSLDGGRSWQHANAGLKGVCVNALAVSPEFARDRVVMAATEEGIAVSTDGGDSWGSVSAGSGETVLSLDISRRDPAAPVGRRAILAGLAGGGVIRSDDGGATWQAANRGLAASSLTGLALSPGFESDATLFAWGSTEGVLRSQDGGRSWEPVSAGMEDAAVASVAVSPGFAADGTLYAATSAGMFHSTDRGTTWQKFGLDGQEVSFLALSPGFPEDPVMAAATGRTLHFSSNAGTSWRELEVPAPEGTIVALAVGVSSSGERVLLLGTWHEPVADSRGWLRVWTRTLPFSPWTCAFSTRAAIRMAALGVPDNFGETQKFFIGAGDAVYRIIPEGRERTREGVRPLWLPSGVGSKGYPVVSLTAVPNFARNHTLLTATGDGIYLSRDEGTTWVRLGATPGGRSPIAAVPSPAFAENGVVYALTVGGQLWRWEPAG